MTYECIEITEAHAVWADNAAPMFGMGAFGDATRIRILRSTTNIGSIHETSEAFECSLMAGLWPDRHEIALMVLGYAPGSEEANEFLQSLVENLDGTVDATPGKEKLLTGVLVTPVWGDGQRERSVFVTGAFTRGTATNETMNLQRTGPAGGQQPQAMAFDLWRLMLDKELTKQGTTLTGDLEEEWLREQHGSGQTPDQAATAIGTQRAKGTATLDAKPNPSE